MSEKNSLGTDAADNWKPSKKSREQIDGIMALLIVVTSGVLMAIVIGLIVFAVTS